MVIFFPSFQFCWIFWPNLEWIFYWIIFGPDSTFECIGHDGYLRVRRFQWCWLWTEYTLHRWWCLSEPEAQDPEPACQCCCPEIYHSRVCQACLLSFLWIAPWNWSLLGQTNKKKFNTNTVCATGDFVQAAPRRRNRMKSVVFMFEDCSKGKLQMADGVRFAPLLSRFISVHAIWKT